MNDQKADSHISYEFTWDNAKTQFTNLVTRCRQSRNLVLIVVFIALFFDNMLLTTVVPIIPDYLFMMEHPNRTEEINQVLLAKNLTEAPPTSPSSYYNRLDSLPTTTIGL